MTITSVEICVVLSYRVAKISIKSVFTARNSFEGKFQYAEGVDAARILTNFTHCLQCKIFAILIAGSGQVLISWFNLSLARLDLSTSPTRSNLSMTNLIVRTAIMILHVVLNIFIVTYLTNFDLTASWLLITGFIIIVLILISLLIAHIVSYIHFIKSRSIWYL